MIQRVTLAYGESGLPVEFDSRLFDVTVLAPHDPAALPAPHDAFLRAARHPIGTPPLAEIARGTGRARPRVTIVIADHTRSVPDHLLIPWLVEEMGVGDDQVSVLVGTGTHRGSTPAELKRKLGDDVLRRFRVVNHDCTDDAHLATIGRSAAGVPYRLNRLYVDADIRLSTGFIEPHFFAGFSGGPKSIMPGVAAQDTIHSFHRAGLIADPRATWGRLEDNPLQQMAREVVACRPPHFILNVTLNMRKEITGVFGGDHVLAHQAGARQSAVEACIDVPAAFPVVVTSGSGYPLDLNFYQTVKGISAASRIVERGGVIVVASQCRDGLPAEGEFGRILADTRPTDALLADILARGNTQQDQWQVQVLLQCLQKSRVIFHGELPREFLKLTRTGFVESVPAALAQLAAEARAKPLRVAVLPLGPLTIPSVAA